MPSFGVTERDPQQERVEELQEQVLRCARFYAATKHGNQQYSGLPYTHHLAAVEQVIRRFMHKKEIRCARLEPSVTSCYKRFHAK